MMMMFIRLCRFRCSGKAKHCSGGMVAAAIALARMRALSVECTLLARWSHATQ
jgi:hypothetical protein